MGTHTRAVVAVLFLTPLVTVFSACGSSPSPTTAPSPTVTSVSVLAATTSFEWVGQTMQLSAIAKLSDGTIKDVSSQATWLSSNALAVSVSAAGLVRVESVTAQDGNQVKISAAYQGATGQIFLSIAPSIQVDVVTSFRDNLAPRSLNYYVVTLAPQATSAVVTASMVNLGPQSSVTVAVVNALSFSTSPCNMASVGGPFNGALVTQKPIGVGPEAGFSDVTFVLGNGQAVQAERQACVAVIDEQIMPSPSALLNALTQTINYAITFALSPLPVTFGSTVTFGGSRQF